MAYQPVFLLPPESFPSYAATGLDDLKDPTCISPGVAANTAQPELSDSQPENRATQLQRSTADPRNARGIGVEIDVDENPRSQPDRRPAHAIVEGGNMVLDLISQEVQRVAAEYQGRLDDLASQYRASHGRLAEELQRRLVEIDGWKHQHEIQRKTAATFHRLFNDAKTKSLHFHILQTQYNRMRHEYLTMRNRWEQEQRALVNTSQAWEQQCMSMGAQLHNFGLMCVDGTIIVQPPPSYTAA